MDYYVGIDLGTSSVRVVALGEKGTVLAVEGHDYPIREPKQGFAEQSTDEWWEATAGCLRRLQNLDILKGGRVRAVGLSGQMHGLVLLDRERKALRDAIIWPDSRTAGICREWAQTIGADRIGGITGLPLATGFLAPSLAWVKRNEPDLYARAAHAILPKDYIRYRLTGEIATDVTDASATLLLDVARRTWSTELVDRFDLDEHLLPSILDTTCVAGAVTESAAAATGLPGGTPVAAGGADIAMAAHSLGIDNPGTAVVSIATGGTVIVGIERPVVDGRMHTFCSATPDRWILMGATLSAGLSLSWFANNVAVPLGAARDGVIEKISSDAERIPPGSEGLLFAPYLCGERTPYMNPHAKGCFVGLSLRHSSSHMVRAIMEGVAYSLCESFDAFKELNIPVNRVLCSGGGSRNPLWRQILADTFERPVRWRPGEEHSGMGAAMTGALAIGDRIVPLPGGEDSSEEVLPNPKHAATYRKQRAVYKQIHPQLAPVFESLS